MLNNIMERGFDGKGYYSWLCNIIEAGSPHYIQYVSLLQILDNISYVYRHPMDYNRLMDAYNLRREFANHPIFPGSAADVKPVSVFEVLVALSKKMDEDILSEPGQNRPAKWFWTMLNNLGLMIYPDYSLNADEIRVKVDNWLEGRFMPNGSGSPFPLINPYRDQRCVDMWSQMNDWVNENWAFV